MESRSLFHQRLIGCLAPLASCAVTSEVEILELRRQLLTRSEIRHGLDPVSTVGRSEHGVEAESCETRTFGHCLEDRDGSGRADGVIVHYQRAQGRVVLNLGISWSKMVGFVLPIINVKGWRQVRRYDKLRYLTRYLRE